MIFAHRDKCCGGELSLLYSQLCGHWSNSCLYRHHFGRFVTLPPYFKCMCVCMCIVSVCARHPTVPQHSGRLVVLGGGSTPQVQSWLIAPHSHTTHTHTHTQILVHTHQYSVLFCWLEGGGEVWGGQEGINPNCGVWEPGERPGLLGASPWSTEMLMVMLPAQPIPWQPPAPYTHMHQTHATPTHTCSPSTVSRTLQPISIGSVSWITRVGDSLLPVQP